jgi:hypothetical protein
MRYGDSSESRLNNHLTPPDPCLQHRAISNRPDANVVSLLSTALRKGS